MRSSLLTAGRASPVIVSILKIRHEPVLPPAKENSRLFMRQLFALSLPPASKRSIELNERQQYIASQPCFNQLAFEQASLRIEHLQITIEAAFVANCREAIGFA